MQVWSLEHTSLSHSLLFVSTPPIIVAAVACGMGQPLSKEEMLGVVVGMGGVVIVAAGSCTEHDSEVTLLGDLASFAAAAAFVVYISAGRHLRGNKLLSHLIFPECLLERTTSGHYTSHMSGCLFWKNLQRSLFPDHVNMQYAHSSFAIVFFVVIIQLWLKNFSLS